MAKSEDYTNRTQPFRSADFVNSFLKQSQDSLNGLPESQPFQSADLLKVFKQSQDSSDGFRRSTNSSIFRSKDDFITGFFSMDSATKQSNTAPLPSSFDERRRKTSTNLNVMQTAAAVCENSIPEKNECIIPKSRDWINSKTLGKHVDIKYSPGVIFSKQVEATPSRPSNPSLRTDFSTPSISITQKKPEIEAPLKPNAILTGKGLKKKKRKRFPRKKIIPQNKQYADLTENDVLMGRGGKSNHHIGNIRYREEIERQQGWYKNTNDKDQKTGISERLVSFVKSYGGNFLEKDDTGYYIIDDAMARRKVSQALREDKDPEKRKAKRQRFLAKKRAAQIKDVDTEK